VEMGRLLPWVLMAMVVLVANADEKPIGAPEHDESLREGTRIDQLLSQVAPVKAYLPHKLQKAAERLEPQYKADGHMVSLENLVNEDKEVQNLGDDEYYGEYTYGEAAESSVAMLQMGEGDQQRRYPWVISQRQAQKREKRLEKQQAAKHRDAINLHSHDIPLKDTMDGAGVRERVQQELRQFEKTHPSKEQQQGASLQQRTTDRVSSLGDSEGEQQQQKQVHTVDDTWKRETEGSQYKQKPVRDQYRQKRVRDLDDSMERDTMTKVRSLGEDGGDEDQRPAHVHSDSNQDLPSAIRHHNHHSSLSAWGDDADDQDDDDADPFDYLELLQAKESSAAAPDMISQLAHRLTHKKRSQHAHEMQQHEKLQEEGVKRSAKSSIEAQQSFTTQLEHQTAHRVRAANAGTGDVAHLVKNRHQHHAKTLGRFVPKNQAETDHNNEIAREVAMQKQLASSFKLAMQAATRKHTTVSGTLKKTEQVRDLFNSNADGITLKVAQKLQPELKNKDDSWKSDVTQEMAMAKQAAAFMTKEQATHDEASKKKHDMKELFPDHQAAPTKAKVDETGMSIMSIKAPKVEISADAQQAMDMQKMMTKATITSNGDEGLIDADAKKLQLSGVTGKTLMKEQLERTSRHFRSRPTSEEGRVAQPEVKATPLKHTISGSNKALKLAQQFLSKSQVSKGPAGTKDQDPVDRNGVLKMFAPKHKQQVAAVGKEQHRLQEAQQQAAGHSHHLKLSAEDSKQVQMQQQMMQQRMAQQVAKQSAAAKLKEAEGSDEGRNIESLFKPAPTKQAKSVSPLLNKEDKISLLKAQKFLKAQKSEEDKGKIENDKVANPDSRAGVEELLSSVHGAAVVQQVKSSTSEADKIADEFATEKKMQMSILQTMQKQQQKVATAQSAVDTKPQSESDLRSLFAVHGKNKASAKQQWSKQQVNIAAQKADHKQVDESLKLENHLHAVEEVVAPKIVQTAQPVQAAVQPISLAQQDVGAVGVNGPATMRKKFTQNMRSHFIDLLEHNKDKFKSMMSKQGVGGAASFYKNMKTDLQAMLQPDALIETAAGKDTTKAAPATVAPASKPAASKEPAQKAPVAVETAEVKTVKTDAVKAVKAKSAPVKAPAAPAQAVAQLGEAKSAAKPTRKVDLKSLEQAVDMLSPEDRQKFIMHRLAKLAS